MCLQVMSQRKPILMTASLASEAPEVDCRAVTPLFDLRLVASLWVWVPRRRLCRTARSRSIDLQNSVLCSGSLPSISHLQTSEGSWPMGCTRCSVWSICCTQRTCWELICNPACFVSLSECERKRSIRTHADALKMSFFRINARPSRESYQPLHVSECRS